MTNNVRSRRTRWIELRDLLARIETLFAQNVQIDSLDGVPHKKVLEIAEFETQLEVLQRAMLREINKLTADRLIADLEEKKEKR